MMTTSPLTATATSLHPARTPMNSIKRDLDDSDAAAGGLFMLKKARVEYGHLFDASRPPVASISLPKQPELKAYPFFYYTDHSRDADPDPLTPLTFPGRVPNFPAKMHAILSRPDLADIVSWCHHGRSWRVLKPREFELRVLPTYFEHAKFSSFIRQANGWGFRRLTQGPDRNSYYHPRFLRNLPHLAKSMKRPGVSEKKPSDPDQEPDLEAISQMLPLPSKVEDPAYILPTALEGPKARMPIYIGHVTGTSSPTPMPHDVTNIPPPPVQAEAAHAPLAAHSHTGFESAPRSPVTLSETWPSSTHTGIPAAMPMLPYIPQLTAVQVPPSPPSTEGSSPATNAVVAPATMPPLQLPAFPPGSASASFAAGFAAAAAFSQHHFTSILANLAAAQQQGAVPAGQQPHSSE